MQATAKKLSSNIDQLLSCSQTGRNVADKIADLISIKDFAETQATTMLFDILVKNWKYAVVSQNIKNGNVDSELIYSELSRWKAADIVMVYHHPDLGVQVLNPKNPDHKEFLADFRKNELLVMYSGYSGKKDADALCTTFLSKAVDLINGKKVNVPDSLKKGSYGFKKEKIATTNKSGGVVSKKTTSPKQTGINVAKTKASAGTVFSFSQKTNSTQKQVSKSPITGKSATKPVSSPTKTVQRSVPAGNPSLRKMTPMISIPVTNELFHNGNVEAWKRIIASYQNKYPELQIFVYYDGERITDINSLFKWGKVKHGSCIQFVVVGENLQDVAKLKRYFTQGASNMFEAFLQGAPGTILRLF